MYRSYSLNPLSIDMQAEERASISSWVALVGALVNIVLSAVKIMAGLWGHSQALIIDGIHSMSDLLTDILVFLASRHAAQGPDEQHPYGHGRFETAATLALGAFLILIAGGILWDSIDRLYRGQISHPGTIALYGAILSILIKEGLFWYTIILARRIDSQLLQANAWHHRSDAISSIVVLIGIGGAMLGYYWLDLLAALLVGLLIAKIGWDLAWHAMRELVDEALPEEQVKQIQQAILSLPGVRSIHLLRTRRQAHRGMVDVHVQVSPWLSVSEGHMISIAVEEQIKKKVSEVDDVTVHIDPENDEDYSLCVGLPLRHQVMQELQQAWSHIDCLNQQKRIILHYLKGRIDLDLIFSIRCYQDEIIGQQLKKELKQSLQAYPHYGQLNIYFELD